VLYTYFQQYTYFLHAIGRQHPLEKPATACNSSAKPQQPATAVQSPMSVRAPGRESRCCPKVQVCLRSGGLGDIRVCNGRRTNPWGADLRLEISNLEIASCEVVFEPQRCLLVLVEPTHNILLLLVIWGHQQGRSQVVMQHRAPTPRQQHQHSKEG
jgi:hypothetical protein